MKIEIKQGFSPNTFKNKDTTEFSTYKTDGYTLLGAGKSVSRWRKPNLRWTFSYWRKSTRRVGLDFTSWRTENYNNLLAQRQGQNAKDKGNDANENNTTKQQQQ